MFIDYKEAELLLASNSTLGEGPVWDERRDCLWWVDIVEGQLNKLSMKSGKQQTFQFDAMLGCLACTQSDDLILAFDDGIALFDPKSGRLDYMHKLEADIVDNRTNDGKCDPAGRLWVGTMEKSGRPLGGNLYMVTSSSTSVRLRNTTISNGLCWSIDGSAMFYIDSGSQQVLAFDFDMESGRIENARTVVAIPSDYGVPDGMTIDVDGNLWIAMWGGGCVLKYSALTGECLLKVVVPAPNVTSCTFGGANRSTLYITTARYGLNGEELVGFPLSGGLFTFKTDTMGLLPHVFKSDT